jgi:DNA-binding NarL/FixJ family response regulator
MTENISYSPADSSSAKSLTEREKQVVRLMGGGYTNKKIGKKLKISPYTVANHIANVKDKMGINGGSRTETVVVALQNEQISIDEIPE